jgi:signal transduction histidine kinase
MADSMREVNESVLRSPEMHTLQALTAMPAGGTASEIEEYISGVVSEGIGAGVQFVSPDADAVLEAGTTQSGPVQSGSSIRARVFVPFHEFGFLIATRRTGAAFSETDEQFLQVCATQTALALERRMLREEIAATAILEERARLAREIHDGIAQHLAFLKMRVAWLQRSGHVPSGRDLADIEGVLETALAEARYAITTLRADPRGSSLAQALTRYAHEFAQIAGIEVAVEVASDCPEPGAKSRVELLRIVQEALNNVRRHAKATLIALQMRSQAGGLQVDVVDNGVGFPVVDGEPGHFGVQIMRERAEAVGGTLTLDSSEGGTRVAVWVPATDQSDET